MKEKMKATRYFTYIFVSVWKVLAFFSTMLLVELFTVGKIDNIFTLFQSGFGQHSINITERTNAGKQTLLDIPFGGNFDIID